MTTSQQPRILLIDDERGTLKLISSILSGDGLETVLAESGDQALAILKRDQKFDLVLLDYLMVGLNGMEVLQSIKRDPLTSRLKVIMISALAEVNDMQETIALGAVDYILKPVEPEELLRRVRQYL